MQKSIGHWWRIFRLFPGVKHAGRAENALVTRDGGPRPGVASAGLCLAAAALAFPGAVLAGTDGERRDPDSPRKVLLLEMKDTSPDAYRAGVERLFSVFEEQSGRSLAPGNKGKAGVKVYTGSGPGLSTPVELVRATLLALRERGFEKEDVFLIDLSESRLRRAGFLPSLRAGGHDFEGHPVYVLDSGKYYDEKWYYDNPMPPQSEPLLTRRGAPSRSAGEDRKSFLPKPLLEDVDFWINLPVYTEHPVLGVNGALVNATLANASNTLRFAKSEANGAAAVAEMAAIPELFQSWALTLTSLERFQFAGGTRFHSLYTASEPRLALSADPVLLDAYMVGRINERRNRRGLEEIDEHPPILEYAAQLGLGRPRFSSERKQIVEREKAGE